MTDYQPNNRRITKLWRRTLISGVAFALCLGVAASGMVMFWEGLGIVQPTSGLTLVMGGSILGIVCWSAFENSRGQLLMLSPHHRHGEHYVDIEEG